MAETSRSSIFSGHGVAAFGQQVVGEETCLCGAKIPVRVEDYGSSVYCPSCGTEIQVGGTLQEGKYRTAQEVKDEAKSIPVRKPRLRLIRSPLGAAAMLLVIASAAVGGYLLWRNRAAVAELVGGLPLPRELAGPGEVPRGYRPPGTGNPEQEQEIDTEPDPEITLELIERMLKDSEDLEALVQAQIWQEALREQEAPNDDPRLVRLAEAIEKLQEKLAPKPEGPPACVAEFRRVVQALADALRRKPVDIAAARDAFQEAERLLREHGDDLAPHSHRFLMLKKLLETEEARAGGVKRIDDWFDKAEKALANDDVTEALECQAEAKLLALRTPLPDHEHQRLDGRDRELTPDVRFARGKRAVGDAKAYHQAGRPEDRNREAQRVLSLLQGLPESRIKPLVAQVQAWYEEAKKKQPARRATSALARKIERRDAYEAVVEHAGKTDAPQLVAACRRLEDLLPDDDPESDQRRIALERYLFDVLDWEFTERVENFDPSQDQARFLDELSEIRALLDQAKPWQTSHRWIALDGAVRQQGSRLAETSLDEAVALAEQDKLAQAVKRITQAENFGTPEVARRARTLSQQWQAELKLRADRKAEEESWRRIGALRSRPDRQLALWKELELFSRRFPQGSHAQEADRLMDQTRKAIEKKIPQALAYAQSLFQKEQWDKAREYIELLRPAPIPAAQRPLFDQLLKTLEGLKQRAASEFLLLGNHKALLTEDDVLAVLPLLPGILAKDPDHEEARALLEKARQRAQLYAQKLLRTAPYFRTRKRQLYVDKLRRVLKLDPDGPYGRKARQLLGGRS